MVEKKNSNVVQPDMKATNGVVHAIETDIFLPTVED